MNPMQPIYVDTQGVVRFKRNAIVDYLLAEAGKRGFTLNQLVAVKGDFSQDDWEQFYQLIGYSISGYGGLDEVSDESVKKAARRSKKACRGL